MLFPAQWSIALPALAAATSALPSPSSPTPPSADSHACGDLLRACKANSGYARAIEVYDCWLTVPFNPAVGTRFIKYWNDTLQFQGTLEYLKQPPAGYQQPAVDLLAGLDAIQHTIDTNGFSNQYQFEAALQSLLYSAHDAHVSLNGGLLSSFYFGSSWGLTSLSLDGISLPKVYLTSDLIYNQTNTDPNWRPSAISHINGTDVIDYLTRFAALNSYGTAEPHADWNLLFDNPVIDVLADFDPLWSGGTTFYPGDNFTYTFEDGSTLDDEWLAVYFDPGDTGPLETGGDFYNFFVLGFYPASYEPPAESNVTTTNKTSSPAPTSLDSPAFPQPDVWQPNLTTSGYLTGYFLRDESLAVLSIPTFWADEDAIDAFTDTVGTFIAQAKSAGLSKVVIDLQQNEGGATLLAYSVFKLFFPSIEPFAGSNMREHHLADVMGSLITAYYDSQDDSSYAHQVASADEWIATTRLNAETGRNFTGWEELYDQGQDLVDDFSSTIRLNTSSYLYDFSALGQVSPPRMLLTSSSANAPFAAEDIIMANGLCASACSLFMEMMHWDAGVKNVVIGGRPNYGPMQTPSGSRAARYYDVVELDADILNALSVDTDGNATIGGIIPNRTNQDVYIYDAGVSLRNQVREGETIPLQMQYEAADCRIFYTPLSFNNFTNLWKHAAEAMWTNPGLCVQGSIGFAASKSSFPKPAPSRDPLAAVNYSSIGIPALRHSGAEIPFLVSSQPLPDVTPEFRPASLPASKLQPENAIRLKAERQNAQLREAERIRAQRGKLPQNPVPSKQAPPSGQMRRRSASLQWSHGV